MLIEGLLDEAGVLNIKRKNKWKKQECLYKDKYCGDSCPAFDEPEKALYNKYKLRICKETIYFDEFKDLRM